MSLNSCGNKPSDSSSPHEKSALRKSIKTKPELMKYTKSPKFSVSELIEMLKLNYNEFENHLLCKGYKFQEQSKDDFYGTCYSYGYTNSKENSSYAVYCHFKEGLEYPHEVELRTFENNVLVELKNEIEKSGFKCWLEDSYQKDSLSVNLNMSTVKRTAKYNLGLSGSGVKTGTMSITDTISISCLQKNAQSK